MRTLVLGLVLLFAAPALAGECTYKDLQGQFTVAADCEGLKDYSGIAQQMKRVFLHGTWGELTIIEVPNPYKTAELDFVMGNIGRFWTSELNPGKPVATTLGGVEARVTTERRRNTTARSWVFSWQGRNLIAQASAFGKRAEREGRLEQIAKALEGSFQAAP